MLIPTVLLQLWLLTPESSEARMLVSQDKIPKRVLLHNLAARLGQSLVAGDIAAIACMNSQPRLSGQAQIAAATVSSPRSASRHTAEPAHSPDKASAAESVPDSHEQHSTEQNTVDDSSQTASALLLLQPANAPDKQSRVRRIIGEWPPQPGCSLSSPEGPAQLDLDPEQPSAIVLIAQASKCFAGLAKEVASRSDRANLPAAALLAHALAMQLRQEQAVQQDDSDATAQKIFSTISCLGVGMLQLHDVLRQIAGICHLVDQNDAPATAINGQLQCNVQRQ